MFLTRPSTIRSNSREKPGKSKTVKLSFLVPAETASGTYFLVAALDASNALAEKDETNNAVLSATAVVLP